MAYQIIDRYSDINREDVGFCRLAEEPVAISANDNVIYVSAGNRLQVFQLPWD